MTCQKRIGFERDKWGIIDTTPKAKKGCKFLDPYVAQAGEVYDIVGLTGDQLQDIRNKLARRSLLLVKTWGTTAQICPMNT